MGIPGAIYCTYYTALCFCPIKRDWILAKGNFLFKVVNYVLLVPFIIASIFAASSFITGRNYSGKVLFNEDGIYMENESVDTLGFTSNVQLRDPFFIKAHGLTMTGDSLITRNSKSPVPQEYKKPSLFWSIYYNY